jgi:hypothetical protein
MENKIPIPTDNIYKFYSLFGLALFIFCFGAIIHINSSTNEFMFSAAIEQKTLESIEKPTATDIAKKNGIEKRVEIAISDKNFFLYSLGCLAGIAISLMVYGFYKWHNEIQPIQDETARLQLEKLKLEVEKIKTPAPNSNDGAV